jgi:hypothetical protein
VRRQPTDLCKLCEPDVESSAINHPYEDSLFLVKYESGVELGDDFFILVAPKGHKLSDAWNS